LSANTPKESYRFSHKIKVRYHEVDMQQIVFNANYLTYLGMAWIEYLRNLGLHYSELSQNNEFDIVIAKASMNFLRPARYDEVLEIYVQVKKLGNKSIPVTFLVCREDSAEVVLDGEIVYVAYDTEKEVSCEVPEFVAERIRKFEK